MKHFVFGLQVLHLRNIANCFHVHVLLSLTEYLLVEKKGNCVFVSFLLSIFFTGRFELFLTPFEEKC